METEQKNLAALIAEALRVKGLSVEKLSQLTGISERPIAMLLEEKWDKLPSSPYVHGYLLKIGEVLGLDGQKLWSEYLKNNEAIRRSGKEDILPPNRFALSRWNKKFIWGGVLAFFIVVYGASRIVSFYSQPMLVINGFPGNSLTTTSSIFTISGRMDPNAQLTINNEQVYPDKNGFFEKTIPLLQPNNFTPLTFDIKKPFGKDYVITKQIFYEVASTTP